MPQEKEKQDLHFGVNTLEWAGGKEKKLALLSLRKGWPEIGSRLILHKN